MIDRRMPRRDFIGGVGASAAAMLAAGCASAQNAGPNDAIHIGVIGTGGRAQGLMRDLAKIPGVKLAAVCDIRDSRLEAAKKIADASASSTKDYRELLDSKAIDAVVIGAPDHWHVPMTIDAVSAGKDVYVEKPLTHDLAEGEAVIKAVRDSGCVVQVGMQQRSMPHLQEAAEIIRSGKIGKIHKVHLTWNRNVERPIVPREVDPAEVDWPKFLGKAPSQPFDPVRLAHWRWFWDFGGGILTDLMVHWIDVVHWFLDLDHPAQAVTIGDSYRWKELAETPDTIQTLLHYPDKQVQVYFEGTFCNARNAAMMEYMGDHATIYADRGRYELHPEKASPGNLEYREMVLGSGPKGADFFDNPPATALHLANWIECMRTRTEPAAPVESGVSAAAAAHLGNLALKQGGKADWDGLAGAS